MNAPDDSVAREDRAAEAGRVRRRMDEVFGEVLPEVTSDERESAVPDQDEADRWYRENRPPHHDR